jgi:hypothetical protein
METEREREERMRNKTIKLADVESREVASFGRAAKDRKTSKNGRTEDENGSQMDGQNATRKTKWTNSTRKLFQMDEQNATTKTKWTNNTRKLFQMDEQNATTKTKWTNNTRKQFQMDEQNTTTKTKWMSRT